MCGPITVMHGYLTQQNKSYKQFKGKIVNNGDTDQNQKQQIDVDKFLQEFGPEPPRTKWYMDYWW